MTDTQVKRLEELSEKCKLGLPVYIDGIEFYISELRTDSSVVGSGVSITLEMVEEYDKPEKKLSDFAEAELIDELKARLKRMEDSFDERFYD